MGKRAAARAWKSKEPKARGRYIYTHCCCDAKQSFQGLFSPTTIMTTPDLTSTPKFKLWSYIVVVAQMRWTTTKLQKDEEEENRDERRRRGNVHGDFQLYYTRHMCCCCSFWTTWKHQFVSKMYRYSTVFLKSWISLNFDTKWCFMSSTQKNTRTAAACSSTCVAYIKWDNNENIGRCSMLCYVVGDTPSCYLPSCNIAW